MNHDPQANDIERLFLTLMKNELWNLICVAITFWQKFNFILFLSTCLYLSASNYRKELIW